MEKNTGESVDLYSKQYWESVEKEDFEKFGERDFGTTQEEEYQRWLDSGSLFQKRN